MPPSASAKYPRVRAIWNFMKRCQRSSILPLVVENMPVSTCARQG